MFAPKDKKTSIKVHTNTIKGPSFRDKMKSYEMEVEWIKNLVDKDDILNIEREENAGERIFQKLKGKSYLE